MAPLKHAPAPLPVLHHELSPWLKCHGSIEALLLEALLLKPVDSPWLKCHGSIEAWTARDGPTNDLWLSMAKMPWLH